MTRLRGLLPYTSIAQLPETLPLFPLAGALLLPRGQVPFNIFEPRYLTLIDDALAGDRLVGMIQFEPKKFSVTGEPALYPVGTAGRIVHFSETEDGRYLVQLAGVARFRLREETLAPTPYRQARVDFAPYAQDLEAGAGETQVDREAVLVALRAYSQAHDLPIDWDNVGEAPNEALVNALSMLAPFGPGAKQALLEAADLKTRGDMLVALTEMDLAKSGDHTAPHLQ